MRLQFFLLLVLLMSSAIYGQAKIDDEIIEDGKALLESLKSERNYRSFVNHYKRIDKGSTQEKMVAVGIIGARIHTSKEAYAFYVNYLKRHYPDSVLTETVNVRNLSDSCGTCQGEATTASTCKKCRGSQACTNSSCKDGKVNSYDRVGGRFVNVQRDCIICKGSGQCVTCNGTGEVLGACATCKKKGYLYSADKALEVYGKLIQDIIDESNEINEKAFENEMIAKGMVKIDGEWYSPEQIAKMDQAALEARKRADQAEREAMEQEEARVREEKATGLLARVDELIQENPQDTIEQLKDFIEKYPESAKINEFKKELSYADIYKEAMILEKDGAISKAIKKYREALRVKQTDELNEKISYLDDQTIGL